VRIRKPGWTRRPRRAILSRRHEPARRQDDGERRCFVTREVQPRGGLIRFVVGPDGSVVPDIDERLPGRGLWVSADREVLDQAVTKRLFARAAKGSVTVDPTLTARVEALLTRRCIETLSLARRAGGAVSGQTKVRQALEARRPGVLVEAADGAEDGRARLRALAGTRPVVSCLVSAEIAEAFGRDHAVHAVVESAGPRGGLADRLLRDAARLEGLRSEKTASDVGPGLENLAGTCIQGAKY
jgi:predicted RNA-binding protein YlxR (DUF448 family)